VVRARQSVLQKFHGESVLSPALVRVAVETGSPEKNKQVNMAQILILEENTQNFDRINKAIEDKGHRGWLARSIDEAQAFIKAYEIDLILAPVRLDNGDVFEFLRHVRNDASKGRVGFVFHCFSADDAQRFGTEVVRSAGTALGATKYIVMDTFDKQRFWEQLENCIPQSCIRRDTLGSTVKTYRLGEVA
jgi:CheY-like chemotaxis protein